MKVDWSTSTPVYSPCCDVTMFCEVYIESATLTNTTEVEWSVPDPKELPYQREVTHISNNGHKLRASLVLKSVTEDDRGQYNVTFSNTCGSVPCKFSLSIVPGTCSRRPDPVQKNVTINVPQNVSTVTLAANFSGNRDLTRWMVIWSNSSTSNLGNYVGKYHTEHQVVSDCLFTEKLIIHDVSGSDAGLYFAKVYDSSDTGVNTTFYVNIVHHGDQKRKKTKVSTFLFSLVTLPVVVLVSIGILYLMRRQKKRGRHSES